MRTIRLYISRISNRELKVEHTDYDSIDVAQKKHLK